MMVDELVALLCKCQVIPRTSELGMVIDEAGEDLVYVTEALNSYGYNLAYNNSDDCFVVY